jgi:CHAD domain-containing protein
MESGIIFTFISRRLKSIERQLRRFEYDRKMERLHQIRVDIKKIRAILSFVEKVYCKNFESDQLKHVFTKAGEIRQCEITIELLESIWISPQTIIQNLKQKRDDLIKEFLISIPFYLKLVNQFHENYLFDFPSPTEKIITNYLDPRRKKANRSFNSHRRSKMHSFRKLLKSIMYVYGIMPKKMKKHFKLKVGLINKVQNKVGEWHDTYAAIDFLIHNNADRKDRFITALNQLEAKQFDNLFTQFCRIKI